MVRDERDLQPLKTEATCTFETCGATCRHVVPLNVFSDGTMGLTHAPNEQPSERTVELSTVLLYSKTVTLAYT